MKCARVGKSAGQVLVLVGEEILPTESRTRRRTLWNRGRRRVRKEELDRGTCLRKGFDRTPGSARGSTNQGRGPRIGRSGTSSASHGIDPPLLPVEDGTRDRPERTRANEEGEPVHPPAMHRRTVQIQRSTRSFDPVRVSRTGSIFHKANTGWILVPPAQGRSSARCDAWKGTWEPVEKQEQDPGRKPTQEGRRTRNPSPSKKGAWPCLVPMNSLLMLPVD